MSGRGRGSEAAEDAAPRRSSRAGRGQGTVNYWDASQQLGARKVCYDEQGSPLEEQRNAESPAGAVSALQAGAAAAVESAAAAAAAKAPAEAGADANVSNCDFMELERLLAGERRHIARRAAPGPEAGPAPFAHRSGSWNQAMAHKDAAEYLAAAALEMANMEKMGVLEPEIVTREEARGRLIRSMMIFRDKTDPDGRRTKAKARLVALGNFQTEDQYDPDTISAHVPRSDSVRSVAAVAAALQKRLFTMDISHAFLHADLQALLYIDLRAEIMALLSDGMRARIAALEARLRPGQAVFLRLRKSIYGLKQAAANWMRCAAASMRRFGLQHCEKDPCVWYAPISMKMGLLIVVIYVDDFLVLAGSEKTRTAFERHVRSDFTAGAAEPAHAYIGYRFERDAATGGYHLSMPGMVRAVLERFGMAGVKTRPTPAVKNDSAAEDLLPAPGSPEEAAAQREPYRAMVGCLSYLAFAVRPDIVVALRRLASATQRWGLTHVRWAKRIMRYLAGTTELGLLYEGGDKAAPLLSASSDASHADNKETGRSTSGWLVNIANGPIAWGSKWQNEVATSTTSAEFMAVYDVALQVSGFRMLLAELGFAQEQPTSLLCDNESAIYWSERRGRLEAKKHVRVRYFKVCELVDAGEIKVTYTPTEEMPSDMLTKVLEGAAFAPIRDLVVKPPPSAMRSDCDDGGRGVTESQA